MPFPFAMLDVLTSPHRRYVGGLSRWIVLSDSER